MKPIARRNTVTIGGPFPPQLYRFVARCSGFTKWSVDGSELIFEASGAHMKLWAELFPEFPIEDADGTIARRNVKIIPIERYNRVTEPTMAPFKHQERALDVIMSRHLYALFYGLGTGKTAIIINSMVELWKTQGCQRVIVVTQKRAIPQFLTTQMYGVEGDPTKPGHLPHAVRSDVRVALFPTKAAHKRFEYPNGALLVAVCSPGALQSKAQTRELAKFAKGGKTAIYIDESQNFKSWSSVRVDNLMSIRDDLEWRYLLSGEPMPLGYIDLFSQFFFLDESIMGHSSLGSFKKQFCLIGGFQNKQIIEYINVEEMTALISPHSEFLEIADCHDMPPQRWREETFKQTPQVIGLYERCKEEFIVEVECASAEGNKEVRQRLCGNAASKLITLRQLSCGWFYETPDEITGGRGQLVTLNDERADFIAEEFASSARKLIIWGAFYPDLDQIKRALDRLRIEGVEFSGRVSDKQGELNKLRFINDPTCHVFYGTTASGGTALDGLQDVCATQVFHSHTYSWGHRKQAEARTWRTGQHHPCDYIDIIGMPIDREVLTNLHSKRDMSTMVRELSYLEKLKERL